jgi:hypothetical protein
MKIEINKSAKTKSIVRPPHGYLVADNITIKLRKVRSGFYVFRVKNTYSGLRIYVDPNLVREGYISFPLKNAKAVLTNGDVYIIPYNGNVVHFFLLGAVQGYEAHLHIVKEDGVDYIPFSGVDDRFIHFDGALVNANGNVVIEYGLTHYSFYREEWDNARQKLVIQS